MGLNYRLQTQGHVPTEKEIWMIDRLKAACCAALIAAGTAMLPTVATADAPTASEPATMRGDSWVILAGSSLKPTLEGWTRAAGWTLVWDSPVDYRVRASASYKGSFVASAAALADSISRENPELGVEFFQGNRALHIFYNPLTSN